jgi:hypothetical protein
MCVCVCVYVCVCVCVCMCVALPKPPSLLPSSPLSFPPSSLPLCDDSSRAHDGMERSIRGEYLPQHARHRARCSPVAAGSPCRVPGISVACRFHGTFHLSAHALPYRAGKPADRHRPSLVFLLLVAFTRPCKEIRGDDGTGTVKSTYQAPSPLTSPPCAPTDASAHQQGTGGGHGVQHRQVSGQGRCGPCCAIGPRSSRPGDPIPLSKTTSSPTASHASCRSSCRRASLRAAATDTGQRKATPRRVQRPQAQNL